MRCNRSSHMIAPPLFEWIIPPGKKGSNLSSVLTGDMIPTQTEAE